MDLPRVLTKASAEIIMCQEWASPARESVCPVDRAVRLKCAIESEPLRGQEGISYEAYLRSSLLRKFGISNVSPPSTGQTQLAFNQRVIWYFAETIRMKITQRRQGAGIASRLAAQEWRYQHADILSVHFTGLTWLARRVNHE